MSKSEITTLVLTVLLLGSSLLILAAAGLGVELFEDGSFIARGCLPWAVCAIP